MHLKKREEEGFTLASDEIEFLHYVMTMVVEAKEHFGIDDKNEYSIRYC